MGHFAVLNQHLENTVHLEPKSELDPPDLKLGLKLELIASDSAGLKGSEDKHDLLVSVHFLFPPDIDCISRAQVCHFYRSSKSQIHSPWLIFKISSFLSLSLAVEFF